MHRKHGRSLGVGSLLDLLAGVQRLPEILPLVEAGVFEEVVLRGVVGEFVQLRWSIFGKP